MYKQTVQLLAGLTIAAGFFGMMASLVALGSPRTEYITGGTVGLLAGAVLIGSGLIASAILSIRE